jgi:hypothetical protein
MYDLYDDDADENVYFQYCGYFSQEIIQQSVEAIDQLAETRGVAAAVRRRLVNAFIEVSQNIIHYSHDTLTAPDATDNQVRFGSVEITAQDGGFMIAGSNPVSQEQVERLTAKIEALAELDAQALRDRYHQALRAETEEGSKGGGIGFIRLARVSSRGLEYGFQDAPINPEIKIFNLTVTVSDAVPVMAGEGA